MCSFGLVCTYIGLKVRGLGCLSVVGDQSANAENTLCFGIST